MDLNPKEKTELLFEVLNQLTLFQQTADGVKILDLAIKNSQEKLLKIQTPKQSPILQTPFSQIFQFL